MAFHFSPKVVTDGLVFCMDPVNVKSYPGSTNVYDIAKNYSGTLNNGVSYTNPFFTFDGIDDSISFGTFDLTAGVNLTFDFWLNIGSSQVTYADILDYDHGGGGFVLQQYYPLTADYWYFAWYTGPYPWSYEFFYLTLPLNQDFHLCITKSGGTFTSYINGVYNTSASGTSTITATGKSMKIGDLVGGGRNFNGKISATKIYNRALSSGEVSQNYNSVKKRFGL